MPKTQELTQQERTELEALRAEKQAAEQKALDSIRFKVSEKGAVSVYGLNARFPVTLYAGQWERLSAKMGDLMAFIAENEATVARKK